MGVDPVYDEDEQALLDVSVPRVVNSDIASARSELEALGLSVRVEGDGDTVTSQLQEPASR